MVYVYTYFVVTGIITKPPEDTTVCQGGNVTISCEYNSTISLSISWIINQSRFRLMELMNMSDNYVPNDSQPDMTSLTVLSLKYTTNFSCVIPLAPEVFSLVGTVLVLGKCMCIHSCYRVDCIG